MASDEEDDNLANFLESDLLSDIDQEESDTDVDEDKEEGRRDGKRLRLYKGGLSEHEEKGQQEAKRFRTVEGETSDQGSLRSCTSSLRPPFVLEVEGAFSPSKEGDIVIGNDNNNVIRSTDSRQVPKRMETGIFMHIPPELLYYVLKFLSSEDLVSCSLVCRFLSNLAADESLWRRLYCMRWGVLPPKKLRECAWKKLYIQRDGEDMAEFVRNCPSEFKEYYIQMQVAKRSQAPHLSQVNDDRVILDKTLADQVSTWKSSKGLTDAMVINHACSGETCTYYRIGDVFVCEKTGSVHVCDDTCKDVVIDPANELLVCTISGRCFESLLTQEADAEQQQGGAIDEAEPFMGSGRFARAYELGYNCADEKELENCLRFW